MNARTKVALPRDAALAQLFCNASKELRLEKTSCDSDAREGAVTKLEKTSAGTLRVHIKYDDSGSEVRMNLRWSDLAYCWETASGSRYLVCYEAEPAEDPMTCDLRVGDTVEVMYKGGIPAQGTRTKLLEVGYHRYVVAKTDGATAPFFSERSSLKLISRAGAPMATPVEPAKPAPKEEFSDKGIMPSDHPGINEMLKKGFKDIFGGDLVPAPAKRTLPSSKALFITASERYMGLGFNDGKP